MAGRFITLEGGEGCGKTTQIAAIAERLELKNIDCILTREPGGSPGAEAIREILVKGSVDRWDAMTEALLMYAARRDHVEQLIKPTLKENKWVISDRFLDSTMAYQGLAGALGEFYVSELRAMVLDDFAPDLTLILDLPADVGLKRARSRMAATGSDHEDRFESKGLDYHQKLRQAYLDIAAREPERCHVIDARGDEKEVATKIWRTIQSHFAL